MKLKFPTYVILLTGVKEDFTGIARVDHAVDQADHYLAKKGEWTMIAGEKRRLFHDDVNDQLSFYVFETFTDHHKLVRMVMDQ